MKKLFAVLLVIMFCFTASVNAEPVDLSDIIAKAPVINEGLMYSIDDQEAKPSTSFALIQKNDFALELGAIAQDDEMFLAISYHIVNLKEDKNIDIWILDLIDINVSVGYGYKEIGDMNEGDILLGATLLKWKM